MRLITLTLLFLPLFAQGQSLPIDFESDLISSDFVDFDGGEGSVVANPLSDAVNTSEKVGKIVRDGGAIWAGSKIPLDVNLDFSLNNTIVMKVFTTAPVGTIVKFKLEGSGQTERDAKTTVTNAWEELKWDFTGTPNNLNELVFMFDFGSTGNGAESSTFYFDDVKQEYGGAQIDLPVNFESSTVNYSMSDFGGNESELTEDPFNPGNKVIKVIKTDLAATWAGTTIGTPAGFTTNIPLSMTTSKMTVKVWSPEAGTPIRLKVEDSDDPTHTCETETNTTVSGGWETLEFDFTNQAPGTELLSIGLGMGWTYNMASIFFNFGTEGAVAGEQTYYFDDVQFGDLQSNTTQVVADRLLVYPNPSEDQWRIYSEQFEIEQIEIYNSKGQQLLVQRPNARTFNVDASSFTPGVYFAKITTASQTQSFKLLKN
ncbi:MAG: T9SS type A sorting domain-containing protein [Saprospiraceae bacterium]|nr:T9SS type A sorting domain-containing protein [Saprospiraceae bacterium]